LRGSAVQRNPFHDGARIDEEEPVWRESGCDASSGTLTGFGVAAVKGSDSHCKGKIE